MNERLIENWLDKANERTFQAPVCHSLAAEGYTVVHLSRHCAMEMGKDILAVAPDGVPCAFQVKGIGGGRLTLGQYRSDLERQITSLALCAIDHPAIKTRKPHRPFIVLNGELDEEVSRALQDFNRAHPKNRIRTILRGELISRFKRLQADFWPAELADTKLLLEMYFLDGRATLPKEKLASLFEGILPFERKEGKRPSRETCSRSIAACAIFCSQAISAFSNADNHAAVFEAWTLFFSYVLGLAERWNLPRSCYATELDVASRSMFNALARLCDELQARGHVVEGDPLVDSHVVRARITHLLGLMGLYGLWLERAGPIEGHQSFVRAFFKEREDGLWLWGEYATPQILSWYFYASKIDGSSGPDERLCGFAEEIIRLSDPEVQGFLASPYYDADVILPHLAGVADDPLEDRFDGHSFALESLVHLLVRANLKQHVKRLWPGVTKVWSSVFEPEPRNDFYRWHCSKGVNRDVQLVRRGSWQDLQRAAFESKGTALPRLIRQFPIELLAILCVMPHRLSSSATRWLASNL